MKFIKDNNSCYRSYEQGGANIVQATQNQPLPEVWQTTYQRTTQAKYRAWWEEAESGNEGQALEIVRLSLLDKEVEVAGEIGALIATNWVSNSRFVEALNLCQSILAVSTDYRILGTIAQKQFWEK